MKDGHERAGTVLDSLRDPSGGDALHVETFRRPEKIRTGVGLVLVFGWFSFGYQRIR